MSAVRSLAVLAVALAGSLLVCLLLDFFIVSKLLTDPDKVNVGLVQVHGDGWYELKPNLNRSLAGWGSAIFPVSTDANGFRINDNRNAQGSAKFIFLGDSFTYGVQGQWSDTFVGIFEAQSGAAVVNAGFTSYSPTAYLHQYRRALAAKALAPRHTIVVALDISDVQDEAAVWEAGSEHPQKMPAALQVFQSPAVDEHTEFRKMLASRFIATKMIYRLVRSSFEKSIDLDLVFTQLRSAFTWRAWTEIEAPVDPQSFMWTETLGYQPLGVAGGLAKIRKNMKLLADTGRENGAELWLLIYPWPAQLKFGQAAFDWESFGNELCLEIACRGLINTFPLFRTAAHSNPNWYPQFFVAGDFHLSRTGNQLIADELVKALASLR